jgi:hypothetical protein
MKNRVLLCTGALVVVAGGSAANAASQATQSEDAIRATGTMRSITQVADVTVEDADHQFLAIATDAGEDGKGDRFDVHFRTAFWNATTNPLCARSDQVADGCRFGGQLLMGDVAVGSKKGLRNEGVGTYTDASVGQQISNFTINPRMVSCGVGTVAAGQMSGPFAMLMYAKTVATYRVS